MTTPGEVGNPLIMYTGAFGQFVYLLPGDPYLRAPAMDHFGVQVATLEQLAGDRRTGEGTSAATNGSP